ncbi:MAG: CapA family protein [Candidatus Eisenbacteria sp.]|nr:CapA family protein [Candidatus Eisenbacteria bacterium]
MFHGFHLDARACWTCTRFHGRGCGALMAVLLVALAAPPAAVGLTPATPTAVLADVTPTTSLALPSPAEAPSSGGSRAIVLADFESGSAPLQSYDDEDFDPDAWAVQSANTYAGSDYALRLWGNTWKELPITAHSLSMETVFQAAIYTEDLGELHAFGVGDASENVLFYCVSGEQLVLSDRWNVVYQGAFETGEWHPYRFAVGRDWFDTWGYLPEITRLIFVNDRDGTSHGKTVFDEIYDVTAELPQAPCVAIEVILGAAWRLSAGEAERLLAAARRPDGSLPAGLPASGSGEPLYRLEVTFQSLVDDPDSGTHTYLWDFGDGTTSDAANPSHSFTATADYTFTVSLDVTDDTGLFGRDTCQVAVEPGSGGGVVSINFTGDIFMGRAYENPGGLIDTYGVEYLWEPTLEILGGSADITVVNAECAFTDRGERHPTKSVVFRTSPENVAGLVYAGVDVASTGNNHIIDYGLEGLLQTHAVFDSVGIVHGGSGINDYFAHQPCYATHDGVRFGFVNFCNRTGREYNYQPFLDAGVDKCGFGYWLEPNIERAIAQAESLADVVIAFPHSGEEYETAPPEARGLGGGSYLGGRTTATSPISVENCPPFVPESEAQEFKFRIWPGESDRQLRYRAVDLGAAAVLNAHPHVLQGFEVYNGVLIAHSLGNFMFDLYYPETMPTIVLRARADKSGILGWTFKPVFIDHYVPVPSSGRPGREILDRMADYSRQLGAWVGVDPMVLTGTIFLDPADAYPEVSSTESTAALTLLASDYVSQPIALAGDGSLSAITALAGVSPSGCEVRWGREVLWFGRFEEDEGHHMWNLNSGGEWLDDVVFYEGAHGLALLRYPEDSDNVITMLEKHLPADASLCYGINGWMKTENAAGAKFSLRFYNQRYTWSQIVTLDAGDPVDGTSDWTWYTADFDPVGGAEYFNVRCNLDRPAAGAAHAWFDDLKVVEWQAWQPLTLPMDVPYPNNFRFLQIRTPEAGTAVTVTYEETALTDGGLSAAPMRDTRRPVGVLLDRPAPNPFRGGTALRYRLSGSAQVSCEIFDLSGRLIERLADREWQRPGWHRIDWEARNQPVGVYFARLTVNRESHGTKLILLK